MPPRLLLGGQRFNASHVDHRVPSVIFYSHDGYGLGHLSRNLFLARCLREREPSVDILIVTSSPAGERLATLDAFEHIKLPAVTKVGVDAYRPYRLNTSLEAIVELRSRLLLTTVQQLRPDMLVVDHRPHGLKGETLDALRWLQRYSPQTATIVGLRDVVDDAGTVIRTWEAQGIYDVLHDLYDHVLVYGERGVLDVAETYAIPEKTARKIRYVGYLGRGRSRQPRQEVRRGLDLGTERLVVTHGGGGGDAFPLLRTYLRCVPLLPADVRSLVVTGPLMDEEERAALAREVDPERVTLVEYQEGLASLVAAADVSVSMAGYNTVCEILAAGVRAVVVPRVFPRTEQLIRARLLAERGLLDVLPWTSLDPRRLAECVIRQLSSPLTSRRPVSLDGGHQAGRFLASLLPIHGRYQAVNA